METKPNFIVPLADASAGLSQVGGKGASLARLAAAGLPVPPGFHITTAAYRRFVAEHGLQEQILAAVSTAAPDQPGTLAEATVQTDIAWTLIFPRASAVVTDVGAPLSHAAIVARELGIPAVVGCGNATMLLKTGDRICVDGGRGTVEILARMD